MRKNYQMWLLGALFGGLVLPFAGCSNEDDPTPNGPGSGETFETELSIALTAGSGAKTKATDGEVQNGTVNFSGLTNIALISYSNVGVGETWSDINDVNFGATSTSRIIDYHNLQTIDANEQIYGDANHYVKKQQTLTLKQENQGFVFYGESAYPNPIGRLATTIVQTGNLGDMSFDLVALNPESVYKTPMEEYLEKVYLALYALKPAYVKYNPDSPEILYNNLNTAKSGSFMQIADLMAQLYVMADKLGNDLEAGIEEKRAALKGAIYSADNTLIFTSEPEGTYTLDTGSGASISDLTYTAEGSLANVLAEANAPEAYYNLTFCEHGENGTDGEFLSISNSSVYTSPAALYYFVNTYPVSYDESTFGDLTWTEGKLVTSNDLAKLGEEQPAKIAMAHSVQYAVGRLDVLLKGNTILKDYANNDISFGDLELKGVLIGNQKKVGWNFLPNNVDQKVIYDNVVGAGLYNSVDDDGYTSVAKVLALPTANGENVRIALEFIYNGTGDFVGANGQKIPSGSIFYVTGLLKVSEGTSVGETIDNIFVSDYTTTARLTLTSVKSAQNTVPDLSNEGGNMEFALSVDLDWKSGLNFDISIGDEIQ